MGADAVVVPGTVTAAVAHPNSAADATMSTAAADQPRFMLEKVTGGILVGSSRSELSQRRVLGKITGRNSRAKRGAAVNIANDRTLGRRLRLLGFGGVKRWCRRALRRVRLQSIFLRRVFDPCAGESPVVEDFAR